MKLFALCTLLALTVCSKGFGQIPANERWSLGADSLIKGVKYSHIARIAGNRIVQDARVDQCMWEVAALNGIIAAHKSKDIDQDVALAAKVGEAALCDAERLRCMESWGKAERRSKGWKTACMVVSGIAAVTTGLHFAK